LIGYRTNPHLDQRQRGHEAARLMARILRGQAHPTQAAAFPPLAVNIERQHTASPPCRECFDAIGDMLTDQRVLSVSLLLGFPYADVNEMGTSALVVTNDEPELAQNLADQIAKYLVHRSRDFLGQGLDVDAAIDQARQLPGPVCLLDMGDNVGGGAPGDGTLLLEAATRAGVRKTLICLFDPSSVERATQAGIGKSIQLELGAKQADSQGQPLAARVRVRGLYDGRFSESQPRHGGQSHYDMGPTAVVELADGPTVILTSRRVAPFSLGQLASCALDPRDFQLIVAKGVNAPLAAYAPVCPAIIKVDTPGVTTADMTRLTYRHRRRPLFPFESIS
jgi:microcystin degradation protein MlrC